MTFVFRLFYCHSGNSWSEFMQSDFQGTSHNKLVRRGSTLSGVGWGRRVNEGTTYLMNITDKILSALKFESTHIYSASKSQHP